MLVVWSLASEEVNMATQVQILGEICISQSANTLGKGMNPTIFLSAMNNSRADFNLGMATSLEEGKLNSNLLNSV